MKKFLIFLLPLYALAAGGSDYDIIPRVVNFLIFVAILYYFTASAFRTFFKNRILKISSRLDEIQKKLLESKTKKFEVNKKLEEAKANAANSLMMVKKEVEILVNSIQAETQNELLLMDKQFEEQKNYALRKMEKELVSQILVDVFNDSDFVLRQDEIIDMMMKKVS